jgi:hypothetical protein
MKAKSNPQPQSSRRTPIAETRRLRVAATGWRIRQAACATLNPVMTSPGTAAMKSVAIVL